MKKNKLISLLSIIALIASPVYAKKDKDKDKQIPPGLQKKVDNGKPLPPGWQKKLAKGEIMDNEVFQKSTIVVPVDSRGLITVRIEGKLVRLYKATKEIVDIIK